tara:strand:+ start:649 stop:1551 length:903 start_codon:yes stop_codon:yes gene_type:complete
MVTNSFRLISLWSTKVSNLDQSIHSNIWGLGDLIRGTFQLYQICRKHNLSFELDFRNHPISQIMIEKTEFKYKNTSRINFHIFLNTLEMEKFILNAAKNTEKDFFIMTNGCLPLSNVYANDFKKFIKKHFQLKSEYRKLLENYLPSPKSYDVLHIRLGDDFLIENKNVLTKNILMILRFNLNKNTILISDSNYLKDYAKSNFSALTLPTQPTHFGLEINSKQTFDNYLEFNILKGANNIKTFSNYSWISGFVYIPSIIYGIPLTNLKEKIVIKMIIYTLKIFIYKIINFNKKFRRIFHFK